MLNTKSKYRIGKQEIRVLENSKLNQSPVVRQIQAFKMRLDIVLNARAHGAGLVSERDRSWAEEVGFDIAKHAPSGDGIDTGTFNVLITGGYYSSKPDDGFLAEVPHDSAIGWKRRTHQPVTFPQAVQIQQQLREAALVHGDGSGIVCNPIGMVILGEGKHRYELHANHKLPLLLHLDVYQYADPKNIRLRGVLGCPDMLHITGPGDQGEQKQRLLPFADLSRRLLATIGIRIQGTWVPTPFSSLVQEVQLRAYNSTSLRDALRLCLRPELLRRALLDSSYV
jgi:hypothetical protein